MAKPNEDDDKGKKEDGTPPDPADTGKEKDDDGGDGGTDLAAEVAKWKAMSRKHEAQAKANADAAKRLQEIEDADKSELQKLQEKAESEGRKAADATLELARLRVAMRKGLTETQAKRLIGKTEEELEADAAELLESFAAGAKGDDDAGKPTRPKERLRSGATPDGEPDETDPRKLAATVPRF